MENFDLKKYLAEGKLLKEDMASEAISILKSYEEIEGLENYIKYIMKTNTNPTVFDDGEVDNVSSAIQAVADDMDRDNDVEDSLRRDLEKLSLSEGKLLKEEIKFIDYLTVDQDEFKALYDKLYDDDGHMEDFEEDFIRDFGVDFLSPNIEKIEKYYGYRVSKEDVIEDFFIGDGLEFISSNERFEKWLDRNREFFIL